jgi:hypothetical protein
MAVYIPSGAYLGSPPLWLSQDAFGPLLCAVRKLYRASGLLSKTSIKADYIYIVTSFLERLPVPILVVPFSWPRGPIFLSAGHKMGASLVKTWHVLHPAGDLF